MDIWQLFELSLSPLRTNADYFYMTLMTLWLSVTVCDCLWLSVTVCVFLSGFLLSERTSGFSPVIFNFLELLKNVVEMRYCRSPEKRSNNNYWTPWFPPNLSTHLGSLLVVSILASSEAIWNVIFFSHNQDWLSLWRISQLPIKSNVFLVGYIWDLSSLIQSSLLPIFGRVAFY